MAVINEVINALRWESEYPIILTFTIDEAIDFISMAFAHWIVQIHRILSIVGVRVCSDERIAFLSVVVNKIHLLIHM